MRYILFILMLIGGLLSFNSYSRGLSDEPLGGLNYSKPTSSCSASAPPVTGSFTFIVINGVTHANINGCDYVLPPNSPVLESDDGFCGGNVICSQEYTWYPTGDSGIGDSNKPQPVISGDADTSQTEVDKINEQTQRYCSQTKKCDSYGEPVDINDFMEFKKKDDTTHNNPSEKPGDKPSDKPDSGSSGESGGTSSTSSGSSAPSSSQPEKPYPDNAGASQLSDLLLSCQRKVNSLGFDISDAAFNAQAKSCNDILHRLSSVLASGEINSPSDDSHKFLTRNDTGSVFYCHLTTQTERQEMINRGYPPSMVPDVNGTRALGVKYRDSEHLNFTFGSDYSDGGYCNSVYQSHIISQNKPSDNSGNGSAGSLTCKPGYDLDSSGKYCQHLMSIVDTDCVSGTHGDPSSGLCVSNNVGSSCPAGQFLVNGSCIANPCKPGYQPSVSTPGSCTLSTLTCAPGSHQVPGQDPGFCVFDSSSSSPGGSGGVPVVPGNGHTDSGDGDNGDVVAAINAFHADANKNHKEAMDALDTSGASLDGAKAGLASDINALIDSLKKEMTDGYNDALAEFKGVFGDIDSYIPDIELSFTLPVQFTNGIMGRCVPLVFDFNITLIGFQPYHFHAEGVQACQLYDTYIRSIVEYMLYFLTALACRRVFIRAAEFITSQP
ncbi:hypothetical protein QCL74_000902 [Salmonella enterica]|nr:hypothetical protein [Salmonella enterica]